jgi:hypothetical protein
MYVHFPNLPADVYVTTNGSLIASLSLVQSTDALFPHYKQFADGTVLQVFPVRGKRQ